MYTHGKLKEFSPENRQHAYAAIELMASNEMSREFWQQAYGKMKTALQG